MGVHLPTMATSGKRRALGGKKLEVLVLLLFHFFLPYIISDLFIIVFFSWFNLWLHCCQLRANTDEAFSHHHRITFKDDETVGTFLFASFFSMGTSSRLVKRLLGERETFSVSKSITRWCPTRAWQRWYGRQLLCTLQLAVRSVHVYEWRFSTVKPHSISSSTLFVFVKKKYYVLNKHHYV